jgi:radical SAM protein with 4Fe4S-binding SPASM domain
MRNPLVKPFVTWYSNQCSSCGTPRLEALLHSHHEKITCPECRTHLLFGGMLFKILMRSLNIDSSELSELSSNAEAMASINAFLRSIRKQGRLAIEFGIPIYAVFDVTNKCNLGCIHCYSSKQQEELPTTEVTRILDKLAAAGVGMIDFGGGEPLLRTDIFDILAHSKHIGLYTSISTNGVLLDEHCARRLKKLNIDHVCVSLDGATPETHDRIRNKKGAYEKAISGIKNCRDTKMMTQVSTVFMRSNIRELKTMYTLLESLHVDGWYIYDFVPAGRGKELQQEVLTPEQRKRLFEYLQDVAPSSKMTLKPYPYLITLNSACGTETYFYKKYGRLTEFFKGCLSGRWVCHISSNGDLHPCHLLPQTLGNLTQETFEDIWFNKKNLVLRELRERRLVKGTCGRCTYRDVCGGCRAQAFWKTDDYLEGDRCWIKN